MILRRHATAVVHGAAVETNTDGESGGGPAVRTDVGSFQTRFARLPTAHVPQPTAPPARTAHGSSPPGRRAVGPLRALWPPGARGSRQSGSGAPCCMGVLRASRASSRPAGKTLARDSTGEGTATPAGAQIGQRCQRHMRVHNCVLWIAIWPNRVTCLHPSHPTTYSPTTTFISKFRPGMTIGQGLLAREIDENSRRVFVDSHSGAG